MTPPLDLERRYTEALAKMERDPELSQYIKRNQKIPAVHLGTGPIRLVILGQDPTVKDIKSQDKIAKVLNLKGYGALHNYLKRICLELELDLNQHIYATNYVKNVFTEPPTQIKKIQQVDVLALAARYWLPILRDELAEFPSVPVITLGEPLLEQIAKEGESPLVREYWDYNEHWDVHPPVRWRYLEAHQNILNRTIFPLPHQPSYVRKSFYHKYLTSYLRFMRNKMTPEGA